MPDHIHETVRALARAEAMSINNFVVSSVSNEVIRQETRDFFKTASANDDPTAFAEVLAAIPDTPVSENDEI